MLRWRHTTCIRPSKAIALDSHVAGYVAKCLENGHMIFAEEACLTLPDWLPLPQIQSPICDWREFYFMFEVYFYMLFYYYYCCIVLYYSVCIVFFVQFCVYLLNINTVLPCFHFLKNHLKSLQEFSESVCVTNWACSQSYFILSLCTYFWIRLCRWRRLARGGQIIVEVSFPNLLLDLYIIPEPPPVKPHTPADWTESWAGRQEFHTRWV